MSHLVRTGCFGFCAEEPLVNVWIIGDPLVILHQVQTDHVNTILDFLAAKTAPERLALCKIEDWDHITSQMHFGRWLPEHSGVERDSVLQRSEEDRPAQLRTDQSRRY